MSRAVKLAAVAALVAAGAAAYALRDSLGLHSAESVRALVHPLGWWGPAAFVLLFAFRSLLLLPSIVLLTAGGICFGILGGTLFGALGITFSAALKFLVAQLAGRERVEAWVPARLRERLHTLTNPTGIGVLGAATAYPVGPADALHIAAILAGVSALPFFLAVGGGALVRAGSFSLFGNSIVDGEGLAIATAVLAVSALLPLASPRVRRALLQRRRAAPLTGVLPPRR